MTASRNFMEQNHRPSESTKVAAQPPNGLLTPPLNGLTSSWSQAYFLGSNKLITSMQFVGSALTCTHPMHARILP